MGEVKVVVGLFLKKLDMSHQKYALSAGVFLIILFAFLPVVTMAHVDEMQEPMSIGYSSQGVKERRSGEGTGVEGSPLSYEILSQINTDAAYCELVTDRLEKQTNWLSLFLAKLTNVKIRLEEKLNSAENLPSGIVDKMRYLVDELGSLLPKITLLKQNVDELSKQACILPVTDLRKGFADLYDQKQDIREEIQSLMGNMHQIYTDKEIFTLPKP